MGKVCTSVAKSIVAELLEVKKYNKKMGTVRRKSDGFQQLALPARRSEKGAGRNALEAENDGGITYMLKNASNSGASRVNTSGGEDKADGEDDSDSVEVSLFGEYDESERRQEKARAVYPNLKIDDIGKERVDSAVKYDIYDLGSTQASAESVKIGKRKHVVPETQEGAANLGSESKEQIIPETQEGIASLSSQESAMSTQMPLVMYVPMIRTRRSCGEKTKGVS